jgi:hypothetical protein
VETKETPRRRPSDDLILNSDRHVPSPPHGHLSLVTPKTEPGTDGASSKKKKAPAIELVAPRDYVRTTIKMEAPDDLEEFPDEKLALAASLDDVPPVDMEFALAWLGEQHVKEEVEPQQCLLE